MKIPTAVNGILFSGHTNDGTTYIYFTKKTSMRLLTTITVLFASALFSCKDSAKKQDETKTTADSSKTVTETKTAADSSKNSMKLTAQFVEFSLGDASHFIFKDQSGKSWDFSGNEDSTYKFGVELPKNKTNESNQGWGSNTVLQGKWFDITYVYRNQPEYQDGPMGKVAVITQVKAK